jgi:hypothetical protein
MSGQKLSWIILGVLLLLMLLFAPGCAEAEGLPGGGSLVVDIDPSQPTSLVIDDGVRITVDNALDVVAHYRTGEGTSITVDGERLAVEGGVLHLGDGEYGDVSVDDKVTVDADGVHVSGETREPRD